LADSEWIYGPGHGVQKVKNFQAIGLGKGHRRWWFEWRTQFPPPPLARDEINDFLNVLQDVSARESQSACESTHPDSLD